MNQDSQKNQLLVLHVLTGVFTCTYLIFAFIVWNIQNTSAAHDFPNPAASQELSLFLLPGSILLLALSVPARGFMLRLARTKKTAFYSAQIISLAVREAGVILAFVSSFLSHDATAVSVAAAAAVVLNIIYWPRSDYLNDSQA